jgi:tetratricopeptide (TPR) repeat protein
MISDRSLWNNVPACMLTNRGMLAAFPIVLLLFFAQSEPAAYARAAQAFALHDFPSANVAVTEALEENPRYIPALLLEARLSMVAGQMEQAAAILGRATEEDPANPEPRFLLGFVYYLENDFERADKSLALANQTDARVLLYRAMSAEALNRPEAASDFYRRAVQADSKTPDARIAWARLLRKQGDAVQAAKLIDEAYAIAPHSRDVLYEKGLSLLDGGQYLQAAGFGNRALAAPGPVPSEREIRYLLVRAWQKAGNPAMAAKERALFEKLPLPLVR